jgi:2-polyprenyl-3-methyl-5-hydroxy-6-metoxy-1,4-benzoquinol methylase
MKQLEQFLQQTDKKRFLDIGTGTGNFIHQITSIYPNYDSFVGIDTHEQSIAIAKKHAPNDKVTFELMDAYHMSFTDKQFDVVCLSNSLHHLSDVEGMFQAMKQVLKDDGYMIIQEMIQDQLNPMQESHKMMHHFAARVDRLLGDTHDETFTQQEILDILGKQHGLRIDQEWLLNVPNRDENTKEELDYIINILNRVMSRVPDDKKADFAEEKVTIQTYIQEHGYDGCPSVCAILKKTSV